MRPLMIWMKHWLLRLALVAFFGSIVSVPAAELSEKDKQFLAGYEKVRAALAADNLDGAKAAAADLKEDGAGVAKSDSLKSAREEFSGLSTRAIGLAKGQNGYYVVNCPMVKKDWLQTSKQISNPYAGKEMLTCGVVKP